MALKQCFHFSQEPRQKIRVGPKYSDRVLEPESWRELMAATRGSAGLAVLPAFSGFFFLPSESLGVVSLWGLLEALGAAGAGDLVGADGVHGAGLLSTGTATSGTEGSGDKQKCYLNTHRFFHGCCSLTETNKQPDEKNHTPSLWGLQTNKNQSQHGITPHV